MCLQDMAIERKLQTRLADQDAGNVRYTLPANPIRHSVVITFASNDVRVYAGIGTGGPMLYQQSLRYFDGADSLPMGNGVVLRAADYGDLLCGPLTIYNGASNTVYNPYETFPTADLDKLIERALPT